ncbi:MAG: hypothetical protein IMY72_06425 [Bacteroidetes bacterium]|nr:hypothetical protein [Bacteroidota bacterium]
MKSRLDNFMYYQNINTEELIAIEKKHIGKMDTLLIKFKEFKNVPKDLSIEGFFFSIEPENQYLNIDTSENHIFQINNLKPFTFIKI